MDITQIAILAAVVIIGFFVLKTAIKIFFKIAFLLVALAAVWYFFVR
ncbi:MAG: hypothetical protein NTV54_13785 [Ignavibacteriales bacterium]|nr:hypothetical protein [Ignavibacteriales bacterium]